MAKTKKKEIQKQGLRPSQKAKAEKLRKKQETKATTKVKESTTARHPSERGTTARHPSERSEVKGSPLNNESPKTRHPESTQTRHLESPKTRHTESHTTRHAELVSASQTESLKTIHVKNADGDPDTVAEILIQNKIDYTPKVSVVMPVYNVEPYLRQCLDSVLNQILKEIEIICVDDGSTDSSLDILKEYAEKDNRITVITQKNLYAGVARNAGLSQARGEYIAFMDADDFYPNSNTLEHMYSAAIKNNVFICGGSLNQYKNNILITDSSSFDEHFSFKKEGLIKYVDYQFIYGYWRFIYNRKFLNDKQIVFPRHRRFQDPLFFLKAMHQAQKFYALEEPTYVYRIEEKEKGFFDNVAPAMIDGIKEVLDYAVSNNLQYVYEKMYERVHTKFMKGLLGAHDVNGQNYLHYFGPKKLTDKQLENIDDAFKGKILLSSFKEREYVRFLVKDGNGM